MDERPDLLVLGGGVGGLVTTSVAAQLGRRVTMIERSERLGGDCLHYGCVPSKTLIKAARVASLMRRGVEFGLPSYAPQVDLGSVNRHVARVIATIQQHDDPERFRGYGAEVLFGEARFLDSRRLRFRERILEPRRVVIATGSRPFVPPIPGLEEVPYHTNEDVFRLEQLPARLAVLGGGAIGIELGQALSRLGSRVTLIEAQSRILPSEDPELAQLLSEVLQQEGMDLRVGVKVERAEKTPDGAVLHCSDGQRVDCDAVLVATGRRPNVDDLDLDAAGVKYNHLGIQVNDRLQTSQRHIYACGDVGGVWQFTHMAEYQAGIVIANAVFRLPRRVDYRAASRVVYCEPELAQVGMTEAEATERYGRVDVERMDFRDIDRAITEVETRGRIKLIARRGRLIGASVLGPSAGELMHELALAVQLRARVSAIGGTIHAYPTLALANRRAANRFLAPALFSDRTRRLVGWLNRLIP